MSFNDRGGRNIEAAKFELKLKIAMKPDDNKAYHVKTFNYFDIELSAITSKIPSSSYEQPSDDFTKWTLLKSPYKYLHASQFTKHMSFINLEGDTLLQCQK